MAERCDDVCPQPDRVPPSDTTPLVPPPYLASVWQCNDTQQAEQLLAGQLPGFVYQRDGHPNAQMLVDKCRRLHAAEEAVVTASGMAALAAMMTSQLQNGDHLLVSDRLYGRSVLLMCEELPRLGISTSVVDVGNEQAVREAMLPNTRLLVTETVANPTLEVADLCRLSDMAHANGAMLLVDNTFATPALCRPIDFGADLVVESVSKMMNGHSDVMLGLACGRSSIWERVPSVVSTWGWAGSPFDCYLAARGLTTMHLRVDRACENALRAARLLQSHPGVDRVRYPGLPTHPDHELAERQFGGRFGAMVTMDLSGGRERADAFIRAARDTIPFCPSLGEVSTTLSHPESTSHRGLAADERRRLGIGGGTIRLSIGCESSEYVLTSLAEALEQSS